MSAGCNGCHGGTDSGVGPPLTNPVWVLWQRRRHAVQADLARLGWTEEAGLHPQRQRERGRPDASNGRRPQGFG